MKEVDANLCFTCSHAGKCSRIKKLYKKLTKITDNYFEKFDIDLDIDFHINDCPRCDVDIDSLEELDDFDLGSLGLDFEDDEDDEDDE